jgi:hypothetical protein
MKGKNKKLFRLFILNGYRGISSEYDLSFHLGLTVGR